MKAIRDAFLGVTLEEAMVYGCRVHIQGNVNSLLAQT